MLHVVLFLLKIIGIFLAALLGLLLLILLLLLFVPVRYRGKLQKDQELRIRAKVSWLLHIVTVLISFQGGVLGVKLKLFGITVKDLTEDEEEQKRDAEELAWDTEKAFAEEETQIRETEALPEEPEDVSFEEEREERKLDALEEEQRAKADGASETLKDEEEVQEERKGSRIKGVFYKIRTFFLKLWKKIRNLKYTFRRFCGKIKKIIQSYRDIKGFLQDERTKKALGHTLREGKLLIKRLLPKRVRGELRFGTEDPALTGEILGGISIFYPIFMDNVKVYPDFEQSILEGDLTVKGGFRLVTAGLALWRLWRDKNVRYVYQKLISGRRA